MSAYDDENDLHCHTCEDVSCNTTWQHPRGGGPEPYNKSHACPKCGKQQYFKTPLKDVQHIDYPWKEPT